MDLWIAIGRPVKGFVAVLVGAVLAFVAVPLPTAALESTSTDTTSTETLDDGTSELGGTTGTLDGATDDTTADPSTDTTDDSVDGTTDDSGVIDDTLDTVEATDDSGTLESVTEPVRSIVAPEQESEEPSDETTDDAASDDPTGSDGGTSESTDDTIEDDGTAGDAGDGEQTPRAPVNDPLPAEPAVTHDARQPWISPFAFGGSGPGASGLTERLAGLEDPWGDGPGLPPALTQPSFLMAPAPAADVTVPLGPRSTLDIIETLGSGGSFEGTLARTLAPFPVAGPATYNDDFGAPRHDPEPHPHAGTDVFAPRGTAVIASAAGEVTDVGVDTAIGGNSLKVTTADGTYFYYAHLDGFAAGISEGARVSLGQVLGFVGDTGNALGTPPHLHYEIHPAGGAAVNPVPYLDRWLANARAAAQSLAGASQGVWTPQVAAPAGEAASGTGQAVAPPQSAGTAPQPIPDLTSAPGDTSPWSIAVIVGAFLTLFAMLRRPRTAGIAPAGSPARSDSAAPVAAPARPVAAPSPLPLPLPGEVGESKEDDEPDADFEWITLGA